MTSHLRGAVFSAVELPAPSFIRELHCDHQLAHSRFNVQSNGANRTLPLRSAIPVSDVVKARTQNLGWRKRIPLAAPEQDRSYGQSWAHANHLCQCLAAFLLVERHYVMRIQAPIGARHTDRWPHYGRGRAKIAGCSVESSTVNWRRERAKWSKRVIDQRRRSGRQRRSHSQVIPRMDQGWPGDGWSIHGRPAKTDRNRRRSRCRRNVVPQIPSRGCEQTWRDRRTARTGGSMRYGWRPRWRREVGQSVPPLNNGTQDRATEQTTNHAWRTGHSATKQAASRHTAEKSARWLHDIRSGRGFELRIAGNRIRHNINYAKCRISIVVWGL